MLRISAFAKIKPAEIILVAALGRLILLSSVRLVNTSSICLTYIGFIFRFPGKSTPIGGPPSDRIFPETNRYPPLFHPILPAALIGGDARARLLSPAGSPGVPQAIYSESLMPIHNAAGRRGADIR